jgi:hypothetical protein
VSEPRQGGEKIAKKGDEIGRFFERNSKISKKLFYELFLEKPESPQVRAAGVPRSKQ